MDAEKRSELAAFYRSHLLDDVMPFWEVRTQDTEYGGYLHCFDRKGTLTDADKYMWCQGRQLWMFSALYNQVEKRDKWLDLAKHGRDFIVEHGYLGSGRWCYCLSREGSVTAPDRSLFTDAFVVSGLAEYALAAGSDVDKDLIETTFSQMAVNFLDPSFNEYHHFDLDTRNKWHSPNMIMLNVAEIVEPLIGSGQTDNLKTECLAQILNVFAKDNRRALFEALAGDGSIDESDQGRRIIPGHILESMWFCIESAEKIGDPASAERAIQVSEWGYEKGYDREYGGIYNQLDDSGGKPDGVQERFGMTWDDKIWWVQSEALYTLLLAAEKSKNQEADCVWLDRFLDLHEWCRRHFHDAEYGEWYAVLNRDGSPKNTDKGNWIKSAFHIPRALMKILLLLEMKPK